MNTWAIIKTGGKQYKVTEGGTLSVEKLPKSNKDSVTFDQVLALATNGRIKIGKPYLTDTHVHAKILENYKDKKIRVVKFKSKSRYLRTRGHRQQKTKILIEKILQ